jgi:hypothetical protein
MEWGGGGEDSGLLDGATRVVVVVDGLKVGAMTRRRPSHMVDLDLQERR